MFRIRSKLTHLWLAGPARRQHRRTLQALQDAGQPPQNILFLCYGNICRSPVAEQVGKRLMPRAKVTSAGFYPEENRSTPANVQRAAQAIGIDLATWRSRRVSREMVDHSDLIVLLDLKNFLSFRRAFPDALHKVVFLGLFLDTPQIEIADPYGQPERETLEIVRLIEAATGALARQFS